MTPRQQRLVRERLLSPVFDGGDGGELANERARANRYEEILEKVAHVLNCKSDFGMILPNLLALKNKAQELTWDESIHTGSWRGLCERCGKRPHYYHEPTKRLFALCAVCGLEAIDTFLKTITPVTGTDYDESAYCGDPSAYTSDISVDKGDEGDE